MSKFRRADLSKIKTISIKDRESRVRRKDFAIPFDGAHGTFAEFTQSLPNILVAADLRQLVDDIVKSRKRRKPVILMMGAHVIKVGLAPVIVDLVERGIISAVAMNSAAAIHDVESAMWGQTSEDVAANMVDGKFGMVRETGEFINVTLADAETKTDMGYGEALGRQLLQSKALNADISILVACHKKEIPATVHVAIGADIIHQQPTMDGGVTGEMSMRDFRSLCESCKSLTGGGVVLNVGSAVIMPEVFLKALTVARNLGAKARNFTTAVFDMNIHYRPTMNVKIRPTQDGGRGFYFTGHHEIMVPLLAAMISEKIGNEQ